MNSIFYLSTCDTCKRIMNETGTNGFVLQDIKANNIKSDQLDALAKQTGGYENLFNKRAKKYREQGLNTKTLSDSDYRDLILGEYTFLKRPVYLIGDEVFVGNSKKTVAEIKSRLGE